MSRTAEGERHVKAFQRWQSRLQEPTRTLTELVESRLVSAFTAHGFQRVGILRGDPSDAVRPNELRLERENDQLLDHVEISFAEYGAPRFQVHFGRQAGEQPYQWVRAGSLVARRSEYFHFWGKPWWAPRWAWSRARANRAVDAVSSHVGQIVRFLDSGEPEHNVRLREMYKIHNGTIRAATYDMTTRSYKF